jgi:hypothetical protein
MSLPFPATLLLLVIGLLPAAGPCAGEASSSSPPAFEARYRVSAAGFAVGVMDRRFERLANGRFLFRSVTQASGLAKLFKRERVEETSEGTVLDDDALRPDLYRYIRSGGKPKTVEIAFDWDVPRVVNTVNSDSWNLSILPGTVDRLVYQLLIMRDVARGDSPTLDYPVADGGKLKTYRFETTGSEAVEVPLGRFEALRLERRYEKADTWATVWVAPDLHHLPVRVHHHERGVTTKVALEHVRFDDEDGASAPP